MDPKVTLISAPSNPDWIIDMIWQVSKTTNEMDWTRDPDPDLLYNLIVEEVPVLRHLKFTFIIEDMSISFREQLVRTQWDDYWIQSGRITDWENLMCPVPETIKHLDSLSEDWFAIVRSIRNFVREAKRAELTPEAYRDIIPVGALHRGAWSVNLQSLLMRFRKRTCWVAQNTKWTPILRQVSEQLREYHPAFEDICLPPCKRRPWIHTGCVIPNIMQDRLDGTDPLPPCPIFVAEEDLDGYETDVHGAQQSVARDIAGKNIGHVENLESLWGREMFTGNRIEHRHGDDGSEDMGG